MRPLFSAVTFLTVLPMPSGRRSGGGLGASLAYFPAVGLLLGAGLWGLDRGLGELLPSLLVAALLLAALTVATRALHLDGFMDTCDGILGGHTRERRLEIMRDSHVGAFAVVGVVVLLLVKVAALASLPTSGRVWILILFPAMSRWAMAAAVVSFPYARSQGLGMAFRGGAKAIVAGAGVTALGAALLLGGYGGLILFGLATAIALILGRALASMLGGLTGDTYGAINEVAETATLVVAVSLTSRGLIEPLPQLLG